jgi:hypothetical protein
MSGQLGLFAPPIERITVAPTRDVVYRGAGSSEVPRHTYVPSPTPRALASEEDWLLALMVAEGQIRWASWTQPHPLPLATRPDSTGGKSLGGGAWVDYGTKGVAVRRSRGGALRYAPWASLLRGLREQRDQEPHIADARDLAHAYSALDTYDRYYIRDGGSATSYGDRDDWRERVAIPHFTRLKAIIEDLGGDPTLGGSA